MSYLDDLKKKGQQFVQNAQNAVNTAKNVYNAVQQGAQNVYNAATGNTQKPATPQAQAPNTQPSPAAQPQNTQPTQAKPTQNQQNQQAMLEQDITDWAAEYDKVMSGGQTPTNAGGGTAQGAQPPVSNAAQSALGEGAGQWQAELDNVMAQIMGKGKFEYNMNGDAMHQQYADIYKNNANLAMQNAMAQASALTGGYGSSYGQMVGQQAYAQQMQGLNDIGLELYDRAYAQDQAERSQLKDQYNMLAAREEQAYNRGIDERNFEYQQGRDETADSQWQQSFDYNKYLDELEQKNYEKEFEYQQGRDTVADEQWNKQFASNEDQRAEDNAYRDEAFEYTKEQDKIAQEQWKAELDRMLANDEISQQQWQAEMDRLNANDKTAENQWQQSFDYNKYLDELEQKNFDKQFEYQQGRDEIADSQWKAELDRMLANDEISQQQWQAEMDRALANDATANEQWQAGMNWQAEEFVKLYGEGGYYTTEADKDRKHQKDMSDTEYERMYGEEGYYTTEAQKDREHQSSESQKNRDHDKTMQESSQNFQSGENKKDREHQASENQLNREHDSSESKLNREHDASESKLNREHGSAENKLNREHDSSENQLNRQHDEKMQNDAQTHQSEMATQEHDWQAEEWDKMYGKNGYMTNKDKQDQDNWQAQFDREGAWYADAQEAAKPTTKYEGEGALNGQEVPKQLSGVQGLTTTNPGLFDDNGYFKQAAVVNANDNGSMTYNIGGKNVSVQKGTSPYTNTKNPDAKNGTFDNGYQPDNIGGQKLTEVSGQEAMVNGQWVPIYSTPDGKEWVYDAANNEYFAPDPEEIEEKTSPTAPKNTTSSSGGGVGVGHFYQTHKINTLY